MRGRLSLVADIFDGFDWDLSFIAFLYYCFAVFTYYLPGGNIAMMVCTLTLLARPARLRWHPYLTVLSVFIGWSLLTVLSSDHRGESFQAGWALVKLGVISFVAYNVLRTRVHARVAMVFLAACFVFFPMRGAFINYFGGYNLYGRALWNFAYENPNELAVYAILFISFTLSARAYLRDRRLRILALASASSMMLLILFTQSRGALLACGLTMIVMLAWQRRRLRNAMGLLALACVAALFAPESVWKRLGGLRNASLTGNMRGVDAEGSAEQRWQIAKVAVRIVSDHPVLGVGVGTYPLAHLDYATIYAADYPIAGGNRDAHNTYLRIAAELGLTGLLLFLAMLAAVVIPSFRASKSPTDTPAESEVRRWLRLGLLAFLIAGLFGSNGYLNALYVHLGVLAAVTSNVSTAVRRQPVRRAHIQRR
ncbi:MAG: O-antigen ligase family protein [Gemmatimonadota bacterium]